MTHKTVFISYSWDDETHKEWVLNLANNLVENGIDVLLDQYDLSAGKEMTFFMEKALTADKVIVVLTPNYKLKADKREGGVGFEYSLLTKEFYESEADATTILPVLRVGDKKSSCPTYMQTRVFHDMRDDKKYASRFFELTKLITGKPLVEKPALGKLPTFDDDAIPDIEKTVTDYQEKERIFREKRSIIDSYQGHDLLMAQIQSIIKQIWEILDNYQTNFGLHFHRRSPNQQHSILFSTVNYTLFLGLTNVHGNSASDAKLVMNFYKGPVGFEEKGIDYREETEAIYQTKYKFELDDNLNPIFVKEDNDSVKLTSNDIAQLAVREVITNEIKLRESRLK